MAHNSPLPTFHRTMHNHTVVNQGADNARGYRTCFPSLALYDCQDLLLLPPRSIASSGCPNQPPPCSEQQRSVSASEGYSFLSLEMPTPASSMQATVLLQSYLVSSPSRCPNQPQCSEQQRSVSASECYSFLSLWMSKPASSMQATVVRI